jgi:hypothetical protein
MIKATEVAEQISMLLHSSIVMYLSMMKFAALAEMIQRVPMGY